MDNRHFNGGCPAPVRRHPNFAGLDFSTEEVNALLHVVEEVLIRGGYHQPGVVANGTRYVVLDIAGRDKLYESAVVKVGDEVFVIDEMRSYVLNPNKEWELQESPIKLEKVKDLEHDEGASLLADRAIADENGRRIIDEYITYRAAKGYLTQVYNQLFTENPPHIMDGYITTDMLSDGVKDLLGSMGNVVNLPDEEDLTKRNGVLKLADKRWNPNQASGMGRKMLRRNMVNGVNVLTQDMMSEENTIYIIQYDFDLQGAEITVPENCVLKFEGGSLKNGTIVGNETSINHDIGYSIFNDCIIKNITIPYIKLSWFGAVRSGSFNFNQDDCAVAFRRILQSLYYIPAIPIYIDGIYTIKSTIETDRDLYIIGNHYHNRNLLGELATPIYSRSALLVTNNTTAFRLIGRGASLSQKHMRLHLEKLLIKGQVSNYKEDVDNCIFCQVTANNAPGRPSYINNCEIEDLSKFIETKVVEGKESTMLGSLTINYCNVFHCNKFLDMLNGYMVNTCIQNSVIEHNGTRCIQIKPLGSVIIYNNIIEGEEEPIYINAYASCNIKIENNYFEATETIEGNHTIIIIGAKGNNSPRTVVINYNYNDVAETSKHSYHLEYVIIQNSHIMPNSVLGGCTILNCSGLNNISIKDIQLNNPLVIPLKDYNQTDMLLTSTSEDYFIPIEGTAPYSSCINNKMLISESDFNVNDFIITPLEEKANAVVVFMLHAEYVGEYAKVGIARNGSVNYSPIKIDSEGDYVIIGRFSPYAYVDETHKYQQLIIRRFNETMPFLKISRPVIYYKYNNTDCISNYPVVIEDPNSFHMLNANKIPLDGLGLENMRGYLASSGKYIEYKDGKWRDYDGVEYSTNRRGKLSDKPTDVYIGFQYYVTDLGKPIWWTGTKWVDATGAEV